MLIERINSFINAVASDIKSLYDDKVNKTDVIAVAQGGTGATDAATARSNLGLGSASTLDATTSSVDSTPNRLLKTGDFGFGGKKATQYPYSFSTDVVNSVSGWYGDGGGTTILFKSVNGANAGQISMKVGSDGDTSPWYFVTNSQGLYGQQQFFLTSENIAYAKFNVSFVSVKSGSASYKKGWRKITATLPSQAGEITQAHGVTTVETVQAKVTNTNGIIIYNNDIDPTNQFYVRVNGANLILGVTANSTKVFGQPVTIYVGEEL